MFLNATDKYGIPLNLKLQDIVNYNPTNSSYVIEYINKAIKLRYHDLINIISLQSNEEFYSVETVGFLYGVVGSDILRDKYGIPYNDSEPDQLLSYYSLISKNHWDINQYKVYICVDDNDEPIVTIKNNDSEKFIILFGCIMDDIKHWVVNRFETEDYWFTQVSLNK